MAGLAALDQLQAVKDSLDKAMAQGLSFGEWQKQAAVMDMGLPKHRLDNIFRTNLQGNYQAGQWEQFEANQEHRPYLMYDAINDSRVRPTHLAMDGKIWHIDDPQLDTHAPINGYRCRCSLISLGESEALARSRGGQGLHKVLVTPDGQPAGPDKGFEYSPRDRLAGVEKAVEDRRGKASGVLFSTLSDKLSDNMKIIAVPGWESVQSSVSALARKRPEWFPQGFDAIHAVSNPEFFAAVDGATIYFSNADEQVPGFKPASLLAQAMAKAKKGEALSFNEEYAVETLWHELMHGISRITAAMLPAETDPFEEGVVQMASRFSYHKLVAELGGTANHQSDILAGGHAYPQSARNLIELMGMAGLDGDAVAGLVMTHGIKSLDLMVEPLSVGLKIRPERIKSLYGHVTGKQLQDFIEKIRVLARNAPRNNP